MKNFRDEKKSKDYLLVKNFQNKKLEKNFHHTLPNQPATPHLHVIEQPPRNPPFPGLAPNLIRARLGLRCTSFPDPGSIWARIRIRRPPVWVIPPGGFYRTGGPADLHDLSSELGYQGGGLLFSVGVCPARKEPDCQKPISPYNAPFSNPGSF